MNKEKNKLVKELEALKHDSQYLEEMKKLMEGEDISLSKIYNNFREMKAVDSTLGNIDLKVKRILEQFSTGEKLLVSALKKRQDILGRIDTMDQPYKNILYFRYVCMKTFDQIAYQMNYSTKRIYQLHQEGLDIYCEKFKNQCGE